MRLTTPRLILRTMHDSDTEALHAVFGDPDVMAAFDHPPFTLEETRGWVAERLRHQERVGFGLLAVVLRETGTVIGDCGLEMVTLDAGEEVELGYDLARAYWGRGFATEAAGAVVRYAFGQLGLTRVVSLIRAGNQRSARVAEKVGMRHDRVIVRSGITYDVWLIESDVARRGDSSA